MSSASGCGALGGGSLAGSLWKKAQEAEKRRREILTEARKSSPDIEAATRRALHRGAAGDKDAVGDE
jgi:hypothetical protein